MEGEEGKVEQVLNLELPDGVELHGEEVEDVNDELDPNHKLETKPIMTTNFQNLELDDLDLEVNLDAKPQVTIPMNLIDDMLSS